MLGALLRGPHGLLQPVGLAPRMEPRLGSPLAAVVGPIDEHVWARLGGSGRPLIRELRIVVHGTGKVWSLGNRGCARVGHKRHPGGGGPSVKSLKDWLARARASGIVAARRSPLGWRRAASRFFYPAGPASTACRVFSCVCGPVLSRWEVQRVGATRKKARRAQLPDVGGGGGKGRVVSVCRRLVSGAWRGAHGQLW